MSENYIIRKHKLNGEWHFDIEHKDLIYSDCHPTHHGLQCNISGENSEHEEILLLCEKVAVLMKIIDAKNNRSNEIIQRRLRNAIT